MTHMGHLTCFLSFVGGQEALGVGTYAAVHGSVTSLDMIGLVLFSVCVFIMSSQVYSLAFVNAGNVCRQLKPLERSL